MNILFDFLHPADVNLFKNVVYKLSQEGHNVYLTFRERGALERIARSEFPEYNLFSLGIHRKNLIGKVYSILQREFLAFSFLRKNKIKLVITQGLACGIASKLLRVKILHYDDDSEYRLTFLLGKWFSDIDLMPDFMPVKGKNFIKYNGYKELAYLHPDYFTPTQEPLLELGLEPYHYVFIREISNVSVNYYNRQEFLSEVVAHLNQINLKVVLSIEDKSVVDSLKDKCIALNEPVTNLYSLIYYSLFVISSGDTMAREASLLGNPCIYTGGRDMMANKKFIEAGAMVKTDSLEDVNNTIERFRDIKVNQHTKTMMKNIISTEFEDTNIVLMVQIKKLLGIS